MKKVVMEVDLKELLEDSDWAQVFADENAGNVDKTVPDRQPRRNWAERGQPGSPLTAAMIFLTSLRLSNHLTVCESLEDVWQFGLTRDERSRLGL